MPDGASALHRRRQRLVEPDVADLADHHPALAASVVRIGDDERSGRLVDPQREHGLVTGGRLEPDGPPGGHLAFRPRPARELAPPERVDARLEPFEEGVEEPARVDRATT